MAKLSVSEEVRASREQMAVACTEIRQNIIALEQCLTAANLPDLGRKASRLVALFARLELDAQTSDRDVALICLRTTGRVFVDIAIKMNEAIELVEVLDDSSIARQHMSAKLDRLGELTAQSFVLVNLPLEGA